MRRLVAVAVAVAVAVGCGGCGSEPAPVVAPETAAAAASTPDGPPASPPPAVRPSPAEPATPTPATPAPAVYTPGSPDALFDLAFGGSDRRPAGLDDWAAWLGCDPFEPAGTGTSGVCHVPLPDGHGTGFLWNLYDAGLDVLTVPLASPAFLLGLVAERCDTATVATVYSVGVYPGVDVMFGFAEPPVDRYDAAALVADHVARAHAVSGVELTAGSGIGEVTTHAC